MTSFLQSVTEQGPSIALLVVGFGFVIFWHELGHFLAAKWAGVRVEQFAVGFGQAMISWRKGVGLRFGSTNKEFAEKIRNHLRNEPAVEPQLTDPDGPLDGFSDRQIERACEALKLGETEYRLNWIPLGGYVKMLGQDDMHPNSLDVSPRAFNMKPVGKRMVIVSAGVIMNVILAMVLFVILFFAIGFKVPAPVVGTVHANSPAQAAGILPGDEIWTIDGKRQEDFNKIQLSVALASSESSMPIVVHRPVGDGKTITKTFEVQPRRNERDRDAAGFLVLGITPAYELAGPRSKDLSARDRRDFEAAVKDTAPGEVIVGLDETIVEVNGMAITDPKKDYYLFAKQVNDSGGAPVNIKIRAADGAIREAAIRGSFTGSFKEDVNFAGLLPATRVRSVLEESSARGKLIPGDRIVSIQVGQSPETVYDPTPAETRNTLLSAGERQEHVSMQVMRDGKLVEVKDLIPNIQVERGKFGLGIGPEADYEGAVIGGVVENSPAADAHVPARATVRAVAGVPVQDWYGVWRALKAQGGDSVEISYTQAANTTVQTATLKLAEKDRQQLAGYTLFAPIMLSQLSYVRQTDNLLQGMSWGVSETKDLILQFYVTLQRIVFDRSISAKNMMGPVGIFKTGAIFASRGTDWVIWFLAMISANLAVVNFLPIPIVDGGLFMFLILEKLRGKPLSPSVQTAAHVLGLVLLLSVLVFVTYNDFTR
jgi:regulator of sigma E protease